MKKLSKLSIILLVVGLLIFTACKPSSNKNAKEIRIGYFPNITHSQALVGLSKGTFQKSLGKDIKIKKYSFNAGPSEIEALFSGSLDIGYIGPSPAVNGFIKSQGKALKIIAGATSGGAVLVVAKDSGIKSIKEIDGKKVGTPQLGNTQDVALRHALKENGLETEENGGSVKVIPTENSTILTLFQKKDLDAAWVPEPWGARLEKETGAKIIIDEKELWPNGEFSTANVIVRTDFLKENPRLVEKFLKAHVETTQWINENPEEAQNIANKEIEKLTGKGLSDDVLKEAYGRVTVTYDPVKSSVLTSAGWSYDLGFIEEEPKLGELYDLSFLNKILKEKKLEQIK